MPGFKDGIFIEILRKFSFAKILFVDPYISQKYRKKDYQRLISILNVGIDSVGKYIGGHLAKRYEIVNR